MGPIGGEMLEMAEADEARGGACNDRRSLQGFASHRLVGADQRQGPRGRHPQGVQGFAGQELADA